jgi:hypothetical protein
MASGSQGPKQSRGYFVPLGNCCDKVNVYSGGVGAGGSFLPGNFTAGSFCRASAAQRVLLSSISSVGAGGLLRDMGKTVVSSNRTFRKVQLVAAGNAATGLAPVNGDSGSAGPYLTGYVELATGNQLTAEAVAAVAPVAYMPGLLL